jgi:hypothetical protein
MAKIPFRRKSILVDRDRSVLCSFYFAIIRLDTLGIAAKFIFEPNAGVIDGVKNFQGIPNRHGMLAKESVFCLLG